MQLHVLVPATVCAYLQHTHKQTKNGHTHTYIIIMVIHKGIIMMRTHIWTNKRERERERLGTIEEKVSIILLSDLMLNCAKDELTYVLPFEAAPCW